MCRTESPTASPDMSFYLGRVQYVKTFPVISGGGVWPMSAAGGPGGESWRPHVKQLHSPVFQVSVQDVRPDHAGA